MAVFYCVECASEQTSYPRLETRPILGRGSAHPAEEVLNPSLWDYQINFRVLLFDNDDSLVLRDDIPPRVRFCEYELKPKPDFSPAQMVVYGQPSQEADPNDVAYFYQGLEVAKVLHIPRGYTFPKTADAPLQRMPPMGGEPWFRKEDNYVLFSGAKLTICAAIVDDTLVPFIL
ncbi:hypothetical protein [Meiothermus sp.]|uniref:hypothetical protein n=1 Tax=Meiothermus sp. TaxID=1955249 RepID=UPI00261B8CC0|nr:hypothetical protein [Meiothermus sp.]